MLTTPQAPEVAVIEGTRGVLAAAGLASRDIGVVVHGTTLATNAIIERKGARTALITTDGFRDVIEIADESRFDQYDINIVKPRAAGAARAALHGAGAHRRARRRAAGRSTRARCAASRERLAGLDDRGGRGGADPRLRQPRARGSASARSWPRHARASASRCRREVCPETREYERTSTAIANAYVQPLMSGYLRRLAAGAAPSSATARPSI